MAVVGQALLSASCHVALENLASPILKKFGRYLGIDRDLKKLTRTLSKIQAVLNDTDAKQINDKAVKMWLDDPKEGAYDADDLLDEVATEAFRFNQQKKALTFCYPSVNLTIWKFYPSMIAGRSLEEHL